MSATEQAPAEKRPAVVVVIAVMQFLLGTGGIYGAVMLLQDLSGAALGVPQSLLEYLPLDNFLIPALILLVILGIMPLVSSVGLLRKERLAVLGRLNLLKRFSWGYNWTLFIGVFLIGWTMGELILWGSNFLSILYFCWGVVTLLLLMLPETRRFHKTP